MTNKWWINRHKLENLIKLKLWMLCMNMKNRGKGSGSRSRSGSDSWRHCSVSKTEKKWKNKNRLALRTVRVSIQRKIGRDSHSNNNRLLKITGRTHINKWGRNRNNNRGQTGYTRLLAWKNVMAWKDWRIWGLVRLERLERLKNLNVQARKMVQIVVVNIRLGKSQSMRGPDS